MYALLRRTHCHSSICLASNQRTFQRGPLPSVKSARSFHSTSPSGYANRFYNRAREIKELSTLLKGEPALTLLLGPPSSGKTALARTVTSLLRKDETPEFHPLTIDLRTADTSKNGRFLDAFLLEARATAEGSWWNTWLSELEVSFGEVPAKFGTRQVSPATASQAFKSLVDTLKPWNFCHGERTPVLVVDEANSFKRMEDKTIQAFLDFAVQVTKQEGKMHIILTSSDSFFESWLKKRVNPTHFKTRVVGDLPQQEAHEYFLHVVETHQQLSVQMKDVLRSMDFTIPFKMTGGRMYFIREYIQQVAESGYFDDPMKFGPVKNVYATMQGDFLGKARTYKTEQAVNVAQRLIDSPGYISYAALVKEFNDAMVEEMIERNFLHYRPDADFSRDLIPSPFGPVVTAQSQPGFCAMKLLVNYFSK